MPSPTVSDRKLDANRTNARKSTGPKSDAGKATSSGNARKHNIFCRDLLAPGEDAQALESFKCGIVRSLNPSDEMQLQLVEQIIADEWRIKRIRSAEQAAFRRLQNADQAIFDKKLEKVRTEREEMEYSIARAGKPDSKYSQRYPQFREEYLRQTREWTKLRDADPTFVPSSAGQLMDRMISENDELERLSKYEQRLRGSVTRSLKQLVELKGMDKEELTEFAADVLEQKTEESPSDDPPTPSIVQNEATETASAEGTTSSAPDMAMHERIDRITEMADQAKATIAVEQRIEKLLNDYSAGA